MSAHFQLKIFDPDAAIAEALRAAFSDFNSVTIQVVHRMRYLEPPAGLDVLYLPLAAAERFGSKPLVHESQVLPTSAEDQQHGLPAYVVTGTCLTPQDPRGPVPEMRILLSAVFDGLRTFNRSGTVKLERVGFWAYSLLAYQGILAGLTPEQLREILLDVVPELRT